MTIPISTIFEMASYSSKKSKTNTTMSNTQNDMKFTTAGEYMQDVEDNSYTPQKIHQIGECKGHYTSEMIYPKDYVCPRCGFGPDEESTK